MDIYTTSNMPERLHSDEQTRSQDEQQDSSAQQQDSLSALKPKANQHHHHHLYGQQFKRLIGACKRKDLESIRLILNERPELLSQRDRYHRNVLHYTVILFKQAESSSSSGSGSGSPGAQADRAPEIAVANLACLNYLLDRCHQKLWWQQDLDGLSLLHLAVISSNDVVAKFIIYEHPYSVKYPLVSTIDNERHSPLHWAVITNNLECVRLLINSPAGSRLIHEPDFNGATPLHYATQTNDYPKYRRQLRQMLRNVALAEHRAADEAQHSDAGRDSPSREQRRGAKRAEGQEAGRPSHHQQQQQQQQQHGLEVLETLLKSPQVNLECRDKDRRTPLLWAASSGNRDAVLLLIGAGANLQSCDLNRLGALHCAASHGFTECLESLLLSSGSGQPTGAGSTTTTSASVNLPDNLNCTPIFYAVLSGNIDCVELLADRGAELDWQDSKGRSAAHFAALKGQLNALKLLRRRGANLWLANRQGDLPLHYAIKAGRQQVARWLLDHSPYENAVNAINNAGRALIHLAVQRDDRQMLEHLLARGANLNQLVRVKDRGPSSSAFAQEPKTLRAAAEYRYETGLDMAKRLGHDASLRLLMKSGAQPAAQAMSGRSIVAGRTNARSLFDLQSVEGPSPIGFDTSSSSAASPHLLAQQEPSIVGAPAAAAAAAISGSGLPKLSRPRPDSLPQSDSSGGSSALSQNSLTGVRGFPPVGAAPARPAGADLARPNHHHHHRADVRAGAEPKPFKGGISYNNERMTASIKCKLYDGPGSFPPLAVGPNSDEDIMLKQRAGGQSRYKSAPNSSGQEIITNVNVYTSPCPLAHHDFGQRRRRHEGSAPRDPCRSKPNSDEEESVTSDGPPTETSCDETTESPQRRRQQQQQQQEDSAWNDHLPDLQPTNPAPRAPTNRAQQRRPPPFGSQQLPGSRLPPSQGHEQHLPVILSDREEATTSGEMSNVCSPEVAAPLEPLCGPVESHRVIRGSPSCEEPRFDRFERGRSRTMQARQHVRSPVGEYIRSTNNHHEMDQQSNTARQTIAGVDQKHPGQCLSHHLPDFSQIKPRVDSHRPSDRSRSLSRHAVAAATSQQAAAGHQPSRSVSRQTFTREHRVGGATDRQDSFELELALERSIRKYKQEKRLFEELQGLKRSQIRSGRANEAVLVKRLVEHLRREQLAGSNDLLGMDNYTGPYTYKCYERFLYDQLRKLSQSNCAKLTRSMRDFEQELRLNAQDSSMEADHDDVVDDDQHGDDPEQEADQDRKFLEEDMLADMELRRVIEGRPMGETETLPEGQLEDQKETGSKIGDEKRADQASQQESVDESQKELGNESGVEKSVRRSSVVSLGLSSKRCSLDMEKDKLDSSLPLVTRTSKDDDDADDDNVEDVQQAIDNGTKSLIEDEANSISSAIMVDALGNLTSRSPLPEDGSPEVPLSDDENLEDEVAKLTGENLDSSAASGQSKESETRSQTRARRRSVVNIGSKMEVIYHDVGIEIDPADDLPAVDDPLEEQPSGSSSQDSRAGEQTERSPKDRPGEPTIHEDVREDEECELPTDMDSNELKSEEQSESLERLDQNSAARQQVTDDSPSEETSRLRTAIRRASSPPGEMRRPKSPPNQRRISSIESSTRASDAASFVPEIRKAFNGHDLDELHQQRGSRAASEQVTDSSESFKSKPTLRNLTKQSVSRDETKPPIYKRAKKERSRLPKRGFRPQVDIDQIKQRWSRVKAIERKRRADQERGSIGKISYFAKSQPNLDQAPFVSSHSESLVLADRATNTGKDGGGQSYTLLYEINLRSKKDSDSRRDIWCQKKVARIVDVRSLKRTLSLPESVIYSNDLLKRFNILKL